MFEKDEGMIGVNGACAPIPRKREFDMKEARVSLV